MLKEKRWRKRCVCGKPCIQKLNNIQSHLKDSLNLISCFHTSKVDYNFKMHATITHRAYL